MFRTASRLALIATTFSCATESPAGAPTRETLPNGAVLVRYPDLPAPDSVGPKITEAHVDLRFGSREGDDLNFIFGDIRGVQAASDGTIYVLDGQALEVRVYSPEGEYLRTIMRRGEGPGEIMDSNGIILSGDTQLWVHEWTKSVVIGVDTHGEELLRFDEPLRARGSFWDGAFDLGGLYWRETYHRNDRGGPLPQPGLLTGTTRGYYKSYDPSTAATDSVYLGEGTYRTFFAELPGGGLSFLAIPFEPRWISRLNPSGGFWRNNTGSYRLTRTGGDGDTLLVIEASLPVLPVTAKDRSAFVQSSTEGSPELRSAAEAVAALMTDSKPILEGFFVDDEGQLWVERSTPEDAPGFYDLFSEDGDYLGSVRLAFQPERYSPIWIQHGAIYTRVVDELDVQYVVRAPIS